MLAVIIGAFWETIDFWGAFLALVIEITLDYRPKKSEFAVPVIKITFDYRPKKSTYACYYRRVLRKDRLRGTLDYQPKKSEICLLL